MPLPQKPVVSETKSVFWNTFLDIPPATTILFEPVNPFGKPLPVENRELRVKKVVATTEADILIAIHLRESFPPHTPFTEYMFAMEAGYQRVEIVPEAYTIRFPNRFRFSITNTDTVLRRVFVYFVGSEEPLSRS